MSYVPVKLRHRGFRSRPLAPLSITAAAAAGAVMVSLAIAPGVASAQPASALRAAATTSATTGPQTGTWYQLVTTSGQLLDVSGRSQAEGSAVIQWPKNGGANQQFQFVTAGAGAFEIVARHSGKVLDIAGGSTAAGAYVVQAGDRHSASQKWAVVPTDAGRVTVTNVASGKELTAVGASGTQGARIVQSAPGAAGAAGGRWLLAPSGAAGPTTTATAATPSATPTTSSAPSSTRPVPATPTTPSSSTATTSTTGPTTSAPSRSYAIGVQSFSFSRAGRSLPTKIWYPSTASGGTATGAASGSFRARLNLPIATGRFPLVVFSHGAGGLPDYYVDEILPLTSAGFIVVGAAYPHSKNGVTLDFNDVGNQPLDASQVVTEALAMNTKSGSLLYDHVDNSHGVGAYGHSMGGMTTAGLLTLHRDNRITAAVILAGTSIGGKPTGPSANVLFIHGQNDPTVGVSGARSLYSSIPWPKAFLTQVQGDHDNYVFRKTGYPQTIATANDWFRWSLYGDAAAKRRLPSDAASSVTRYESTIG